MATAFDIVIDHTKISADLYDFPLYVRLGAVSGTNSHDTTEIFTTVSLAEVTSLLPFYINPVGAADTSIVTQECEMEVDVWDDAGTYAQLWIKVPYVSADVDTIVNLSFADDTKDYSAFVGLTGTTPAKSVWGSYHVVYHLSDESIKDSCANSYDGAPTLMDASNVVNVGNAKGLNFNGTDEFITLPSLGEIGDLGVVGLDMICQSTANKNVVYFNNYPALLTSPYINIVLNTVPNQSIFLFNHDVDDQEIRRNDVDPATLTLWSFTSTMNVGLIGYANNVWIGNDTGGSSGYESFTTNSYNYLGTNSINSTFYTGTMREFRISKDSKSASWRTANYNSLNDALASFSSTEAFTPPILPGKATLNLTGNLAEFMISYISVPGKVNLELTGNYPIIARDIDINAESALLNLTGNQSINQIRLYEKFTDTFSIGGTLSNSAIIPANITDTIFLGENLYVTISEILSDTILLDETVTGVPEIIETLYQIISFSDTIKNNLEAINIVSAILAYQDVLFGAFSELLSDTAAFQAVVTDRVISYAQLIETILFDENHTIGLTLLISDTINLGDSVSSSGIFKSIINDGISFFANVNFSGEEFLAIAYNTQSGGISEYTNYDFNSFSYPYAATSDGIYKLDASDTDDGVNIDASIKTGIMDFGTSLKKQIPYAYLGITENGRVLLKTITSDRGIKNERWYEVQSYNDAIDTTRVQTGKGVKARYWQFELSNIEGENLEIESIELLPLILKRRI